MQTSLLFVKYSQANFTVMISCAVNYEMLIWSMKSLKSVLYFHFIDKTMERNLPVVQRKMLSTRKWYEIKVITHVTRHLPSCEGKNMVRCYVLQLHQSDYWVAWDAGN